MDTHKKVFDTTCKGVSSWYARGLVPGMQGDSSPTELGGIMEVAMCLCISLLLGFDLAWGLVPSSIGLRLGNEGRDPHPGPSYMGPRD